MSRASRFIAIPVITTLVVASAVPAAASITSVAPLDTAVNGQILDDDFAAGPAGFLLSGAPDLVLVAYDVNDPNNGDAGDLNPAGQAAGETIVIIEQEPGNEADNGTECGCIPDDNVGGMIRIDFNTPVISWSSNFLDVENEEGPDSRLVFTDSGSGTTSVIGFDELRDPTSQFYQGPGFILGNALAQQMTSPITAAQLGHAYDVVVFDMIGSEALGTFTWTNALLTVGSTVFADTDDNGAQGEGEPGLAGVAVTLLDAAGDTVASAVTDADGDWFIDADASGAPLLPGQYRVVATPPDGHSTVSSSATPADNEVDGTNDATQTAPGADATTGLFQLDYDDDPAEPAQGGDQDDGPFDPDGDMTIDVGFVPDEPIPASLGDRVWFDEDEDGIQDEGEPGVAGVTVKLWTDDDGDDTPDTEIGTTTTDDDGLYLFDELDPALDYVVQFVAPDRFAFTERFVGDDTAVDSDPKEDGITDVVQLDPGEYDPTIDAGIIETSPPLLASLGDRVWEDDNANGLQDDGEAGVPNVTVNLWTDDDADGTPDTQIKDTTTDANGLYGFGQLDPALDYVVQFVAPDDSTFTQRDAGSDDAVDSDPDPATGITGVIELEPLEFDATIDAGVIPEVLLASLGDRVWFDEDEDGIQDDDEDGVPGVTVNLWTDDDGDGTPDTEIRDTETDADGNYRFDELDPALDYVVQFVAPDRFAFTERFVGDDAAVDSDPKEDGITDVVQLDPGEHDPTIDAGIFERDKEPLLASLGDFVWEDDNANGLQDDGEAGVPNVTVKLWTDDDADGFPDTEVATTATNNDGRYRFDMLTPGDRYVVQFLTREPLTVQDAGSDDVDSDPDPTTGVTGVIILGEGEENLTIDAGIVEGAPRTASLGDRVWLDDDQDGIQGDGEVGVADVRVNLWTDDDADGTPDTEIATTTTDGNGNYRFSDLTPGIRYVVQFVAPDTHLFTERDEGTDDARDSDPDPNTGITGVIVLATDEYNPTIDAGIHRKPVMGAGIVTPLAIAVAMLALGGALISTSRRWPGGRLA